VQTIVSITSRGQVTLPRALIETLEIDTPSKATIKCEGNRIVIEPKRDFWSLESVLNSKIKLSDKKLLRAREEFSQKWPKV